MTTISTLRKRTRQKLYKKKFLSRMQELWSSHGNKLSNKLTEAWSQIYNCFENQLQGQRGLHVSDSVCGTGKTLAVEAACCVLAKTRPSIGGLVVVRFKSEADDLARRINEYCQEDVAFAFHSDLSYSQRKHTEYLSDYQFIIVTHTSYIASLTNTEKRQSFRRWGSGDRQFRVVDESLDLIERHSITKADIQSFKVNLNRINDLFLLEDKYPDQFECIKDMQRFLHNAVPKQPAQLYKQVLEKYGTQVYLSGMWEDDIKNLEDEDLNLGSSKNQLTSNDVKNQMFDFITLFDRVVRQEIWLSRNDFGKIQASIGELILPDQFDSLCILDATSNLDRIYSLFEKLDETFTRYSVPRDVRNFSNANLHIMPTNISNVGKRSTNNDTAMVARFPKLYKWASKTFLDTDAVLFVGHKKSAEKFKAYLDKKKPGFKYDVTWWGAIDGKNTWALYNKLVVTTLPFLPTDFSPTTNLAFKTRMHSSIEVNGDDSIASSAIAVKLVQLLCRIRIRKVKDEIGNCPTSDIYLPLESRDTDADTSFRAHLNRRGRYLLECIENSLNQIKVDEWTSFSWSSSSENDNGQPSAALSSRFITWINNLQVGDVMNYKTFKQTLSRKEVDALKVQFNDKNSLVYNHLKESGIVRQSKRGCGTTFFYES